jgi:hypothetical protein
MDEIRMIAPSGCLGYGFSRSDFERCINQYSPSFIAVDAGSTDNGPYYLGAGESFAERLEVEGELETIIGAALPLRIPVIVGSSGGGGANAHLNWMRGIVEELAAKNGWTFRLATISAELTADYVVDKLLAGNIHTFESGVSLDQKTIRSSKPIVAQMGPEPIIAALEQGAQVILAGRSCDDGIFAAYPIMRGFDRGLALHLGKILECGALASEPPSLDVMVGVLRRDHFEVVPGSSSRACTIASVACLSLYERENPIIQIGPGGRIDLSETAIEQIDRRTVRVSGTSYVPDEQYRVKIEAVRHIGYRTISIAGIRDPVMISTIDTVLAEAERRTNMYFKQIGVPQTSYKVLFLVYGKNGVMLELERVRQATPHELGLVMEVVADSQELARAVCHHLSGILLHIHFPGQFNNAGNLAFPYSPSEIDAGSVYEFSIYHLLSLTNPLEPFRLSLSEVGG